ncbi:ABC transporter permease [Roseobacter sp. GAI101]|uniref:ABC transporter permease n=1 Tax=Roseobacter sp. (strain GAI101) TaxID=391589 RepID=UPI00018723D4|nr:ABC transporter permease subunit [Roseobacter sp. GAI101]EEB82399.1 amino acid ABC transporter, permease protein [Roseobacter sp. GAI101]
MSFEIFLTAIPIVLKGLWLTLLITFCAFLLGQIVALPLALLARARSRLLRWPVKTWIFFIRGSPLLVQLFIIYFGMGEVDAIRNSVFWPILREPLNCAILAVGLNSGAYSAELLRGGLRQIPVGQLEAARVLGMSGFHALTRITLPQVYRNVLPVTGNEIILVMKGSALASAVTVMEMTGAARAFVSKTYAPFEVFTVAGIIYLVIGLALSQLFRGIERATAIPSSATETS